MWFRTAAISIGAALIFSSSAFAAHPLITDDAGTQSKGKFQFELNGEQSRDKNNGMKTTETSLAVSLTYGAADDVDFVVGVPWMKWEEEIGGEKTSESGTSDVSLGIKWRFWEKEGLSFALKPGITLPTGDDEKGLGAGKTGYSLFFITTRDLKPLAFHLNLGYIRNENKKNEEVNIWHASLAAEYQITETMRIVANVGTEKNPDDTADKNPAFILGGLIYAVTDRYDIDLGYKTGLNDQVADSTVLAGLTARF